MECPTFATLVDLVDNILSPTDRVEIEAHLADGCKKCAATIAWLQQTLPRLTAVDAPKPPAAVLDEAKHIFADQRRVLPKRQQQVAFLRFDSSQPSVASGLRGAGNAYRRLLASVDDLDIDVQFQRTTAQTSRLIGQLMPKEGVAEAIGGAQVSLYSPGRAIVDEETNDWGEFGGQVVAYGKQ